MLRILQLQRSIRRFTSVGTSVSKLSINHPPARFYSSALAALKEDALTSQSSSIQNVLLEIQNNLKRWGRISNRQVLDLTDCISQSEHVNSTQALAAIRCFTDLSIDMKPEDRIKNVETLWRKLEQLGLQLDVGHYNALLRAYLDSEHDFNPTDFLAKMAENGVGPNRITYQFLVERYCQTGDVDGATRIMRFMEEKQVPITQNVLNLMIMGHARNNDMESAEKVLDIMKSKDLTPDESTFGLLLAEYARKGDVQRILNFFRDEKNREIFLDSRTVSNVIFQLISNGHGDSVPEVLNVAPAIIQTEFHRLIHRLVSSGHHEACLPLLEQARSYPEPFLTRLATYVVTQYAGHAKSVEDVLRMMKVVPQSESPALFMGALRRILISGDLNSALGLISAMQKDGVEIRTHCYFPLVAQLAKTNNIKELANVITSLKNKVSSADVYTLYKILKTAGWKTQPAFDALLPLRRYGVCVRDCLVSALTLRQPREAREIAAQPLRSVVQATNALVSVNVLMRLPEDAVLDIASCIIARGFRNVEDSDSDAESSGTVDDVPAEAATPESVADAPEERENFAVSYAKLRSMSPQELTDYIISSIAKKIYSEEKCSRMLNEFASRGFGISKNVADELIQNCKSDVIKEALRGLGATELQIPDKDYNPKIDTRLDILDEYLKNDQLSELRNLLLNKKLVALCDLNDSRAVQLFKEIGDKIMPSSVGAFIRYVSHNDTSMGLELWSKYSQTKSVTMYFVNLAIKLISEGKIDDALQIVEAKKEILKTRLHFKSVQNLLVVLSTETKNERCQKMLQELIAENNKSERILYVGQINMLTRNGQFVEAVDLFESSISKFGRYGLRNLGVVLVEKEKYDLLQRVQNILTSALGEEESLFELSLVLLKCGKVRQAKRIIELSGQPSRVIRRVLLEGDLRSLESLVDVLPTYHSQRDEICGKLLEIYDKKNDAENALALYTRFEEENFTPSLQFLTTLRNLLQRCGYEVPFDTSVLTEPQEPTTSSQSKAARAQRRQVSEERDIASIESDVFENVDKNKDTFKSALAQLDGKRKMEIVDEMVREAIRQKNFDRLVFVLPPIQKARFAIFQRMLADESIRENYIEMAEAHVDDMSEMLKSYWFDAFLKGDDKTCDELWLKHALYNMIYTPKYRFDILRGHEERYMAFFDKIKAPPEKKIGAFVALAAKHIKESAEAAVQFLDKSSDMISHINAPTLQKLRKVLIEGNPSAETLNKFDELVKKHGVNVNAVQS